MLSDARDWLRLRIADLLATRDELFASRGFRITRTCVLTLASIYAAIILYQTINGFGANPDALIAAVDRLNDETYEMSALAFAKSGIAQLEGAPRPLGDVLLCALNGSTPQQIAVIERQHNLVRDELASHQGGTYETVQDAIRDNWQVVFYIEPNRPYAIESRYASTPDQFFCALPYHEIDRFPSSLYYTAGKS